MADKTKKTAPKAEESDADDVGKAKFDPKPVNVGGESLFDRIYPHRKKIGFFLLSGFVIWGVIAVVIHFRDSKRERGTRELANVIEVAERQVRPPGQPADPKAKEETYGDYKERATKVLDTLAKEGTDAAGPTYKASLLVQAGKLDEAITELRKAQGLTGLDGVLARESLGLALEQKAEAEKDAATRQKGLEEALTLFQAMQPDEKGPRRAYAMYHQGRVLELLGKHAEAKAAFDKAKEASKESPELAELIEQRLESIGS